MTTRLAQLISSVTAVLLAMAITLVPGQGFAANRTSELAVERLQLSPINERTFSSLVTWESPQTNQSKMLIKSSSDEAAILQQSGVFSTTASDYQFNLPLIFKPNPERLALIALYNSTDGANWRDNSGWNTSSSHCSWYGVTCDSAGHVTSLILEYNSLDGTLPPEVGNLVNLNLLQITYNRGECGKGGCYGGIRGEIPPEIGNLVNLQAINLSYNRLSSIPSEINNLVNLQYLNLSWNQLSGPIPQGIGN